MVKMSDIHGPLDDRIRKFVRVEAWEPGLLFWMFWDENARKYSTKEALVDSRWRLSWAEARE